MNQTGYCDNPECAHVLASMPIKHCPYCGKLQRVTSPAGDGEPSSVEGPVRLPSDVCPPKTFDAHIRANTSDQYCDAGKFSVLIQYGMTTYQLSESRANALLTFQLEKMGTANENKLLSELDGLLHNFTDADKKLDKKEWRDALQDACRARPGYARGLDSDEAERFILKFCRKNNVKVKVGLFKWEVP